MHGLDVNEEIDYWRERAKRAEERLAAIRAARDEACEIAESHCDNRMMIPNRVASLARIASLRKVGE